MLELNQPLFKRLVKLYLLTIFISFLAVIFELTVYPGLDYSDAFDALTAAHFETLINEDVWLPVTGIALVASIVGAVGLLKLKRWARFLFVWPLLVVIFVDLLFQSPPVSFTPLMSLLTFIGSALFGAIVLLAYSSAHGAIWFARSAGETAGEPAQGAPSSQP